MPKSLGRVPQLGTFPSIIKEGRGRASRGQLAVSVPLVRQPLLRSRPEGCTVFRYKLGETACLTATAGRAPPGPS